MSKTKMPHAVVHRLLSLAVSAGLACAFSGTVMAQTAAAGLTISDLANAQRVKLQDDLAKAQGIPTQQDRLVAQAQTAAAATAVKTAKPSSLPVFFPAIVVHGIYATLKGTRVVELTDGRNLFAARTGAQYGKWIITDVTDTGVTIVEASCKKKCVTGRAVLVGGAF